MRRLVLLFALLAACPTGVLLPQENPRGVDAGAGWCEAHGNYTGPSCPRCAGRPDDDDKPSQDTTDAWSHFENSSTADRLVSGTVFFVPFALFMSPVILLLDCVGKLSGDENSNFDGMKSVGRVLGAYGEAWGNLLAPVGQGIWVGGKFVVYDVPVALGTGIWNGGKWVVTGAAAAVGSLIPAPDPKKEARENELRRTKAWLGGAMTVEKETLQELGKLSREALADANKQRVRIDLQSWSAAPRLEVDRIPPVPRLREIPQSDTRNAIELRRAEFNAILPKALADANKIKQDVGEFIKDDVKERFADFVDSVYSKVGLCVRYGALYKVKDELTGWTDPTLKYLDKTLAVIPWVLAHGTPDDALALLEKNAQFDGWAAKNLTKDARKQLIKLPFSKGQ